MDLNFEIFMIALLVLSILVVGNFLRDEESNWLEGALLIVSPLTSIAILRTSRSMLLGSCIYCFRHGAIIRLYLHRRA